MGRGCKHYNKLSLSLLVVVVLLQELVVALPDTLATLLGIKHEPVEAAVRTHH